MAVCVLAGISACITCNLFVLCRVPFRINLPNDSEMPGACGVLPLHELTDCALLRFPPLFLFVFLAFACAVFGLTLGGCGSFLFRRRVFSRSSTSALWLRRLGQAPQQTCAATGQRLFVVDESR